MENPEVWAIIAILAAAAFVQSATGFGLAIVCMAGLPLLLSVRDAATVTAILNLLVCLGVIVCNWRGFSIRRCWPLMIAICLGIPIGYYGLRSFDDVWVARILGAVLVSIGGTELFLRRDIKVPRELGIPICFAGGILGGAFNVGGPPIVAYLYSREWGKSETIATLQTIFLASGIVRNGFMIAEGDTTFTILKWIGFSIPAVILGIWFGKLVLDRTPLIWLKRVVFLAVFLIGIYYIAGSMSK